MEGGYLDPAGVCETLDLSDPLYTCAGCTFGESEFYNDWITLNCPLQFQPLYRMPVGPTGLTGEETARLYTNNLLQTYFNSGREDPFQDVLHQFCNSPGINPGICQNYLAYEKCPAYNYETMTSDETDWCGCFVLPPEQDRDIYGDNIACYPLCHQIDTIQLVDSSNRPIQCNNQVCIIDNVSVNVINSNTGDVNLNQVCPGCTGNCTCIINDVDVEGADLNINQYCGEDTTCWRTNGDGELIEVACPLGTSNLWIWLIIAAIILIILIIIIIAIIQTVIYSQKSRTVIVNKT